MSEAKDSITNLSTNQQKPDTETQKVESLDNIETEQRETADKVKPTPIIFNITTTKTKSRRDKGIYITSLITKKIPISVHLIGRNIKENLEKIIVQEVEGKCIAEGYIKKNSVEIVTHSSGVLKDNFAIFDVVFTCKICLPVEGMLIDCQAKNITKAGIRAETNEEISPVTIFIARDHHFSNDIFSQVKENDEIRIRVIGQRFELFDKSISVIGELVKKSKIVNKSKKFSKKSGTSQRKPRLIIQGE